VQLVAGGSGIVPVIAMLRTHGHHENGADMRTALLHADAPDG
jgi:ferredoxin-NADP reductase